MNKFDNNISENDVVEAIKQVGKDKDSIQALQSISKSDLEELLEQEIMHTDLKESGHKKSYVRHIVYSAISIAAIITIVVTINLFNDKSGEELFLAYYAIPDNEITISRGGVSDLSPESQKVISDFYNLYGSMQYYDALKLVTSTFSDGELRKNPELLFHISICQLETNKTNDAERCLMQLSELGDSFSHFQAVDWYLALTYLKRNEIEKATGLLEQIKDDGRYYSDKAAEILIRLK